MRCSHCFLDRSVKTNTTLPKETVAKIVQKLCEDKNQKSINWGGGEPLKTGKEYMKYITDLECFDDEKTQNLLYSTMLIKLDEEWANILNRFDCAMFSLDSYRKLQKGFNIELALSNLSRLSIKKEISYTPHIQDTEADVEQYYIKARDLGAMRFHMGFLYADELIPPDIYIRFIDKLVSLEAIHTTPKIGFFSEKEKYSGKLKSAVGWRAYDCFTRGLYFAQNGIVTSCYIMLSRGMDVPIMTVEDFLNGAGDPNVLNKDFVPEFFLHKTGSACSECDYYSLCVGGCPYFTKRSQTGQDYYCDVYKKIFGHLVAE